MALIFSEISLLTTVVKEEQEAAATFFSKSKLIFCVQGKLGRAFSIGLRSF